MTKPSVVTQAAILAHGLKLEKTHRDHGRGVAVDTAKGDVIADARYLALNIGRRAAYDFLQMLADELATPIVEAKIRGKG